MSGYTYGVAEGKNGSGRTKANGGNSLVKFKEAKKEMQKILSDLSGYVSECGQFVGAIIASEERFHTLMPPALDKKVGDFNGKIKAIQSVIERNHMKCAFFGRTSNGKSTVINAMLGHRVLPAGIGHTTCCFLQVEGTDQDVGFTLFSNQQHPQSLDSLRELAHSISAMKLSCDSIIHIYWPSALCSLLKEEVVFLDSPGVDIDPDMDSWIDNHCMDADVFILVANAESTLMQAEKNFFHKVSQKLSKPNIFILNNRWDASAMETDIEEVRQQHTERCKDFLVNELKVCGKEEAAERVFFISAKEVLLNRARRENCQATGDIPSSPMSSTLAEGWQARLMEFTNFERIFQKIISESAIKTKFSSHAEQGRSIAAELKEHLEAIYESSVEEKDAAVNMNQLSQLRFESVRSELLLAGQAVDAALVECLVAVEQRVAETLHEEIRQLDELVNHFQRPFYPDAELRLIYKKEMNEYVERTLGTRLEDACTAQLSKEVARLESFMLDSFQKMQIDDECRVLLPTLVGKSTFRPVFHIDCRNICGEFQEDVAFQFSLGFTRIVNRIFSNPKSPKHQSAHRLASGISSGNISSSTILPLMASTFPSLISRNSLGVVVALGVCVRATGWRVLAACGILYGSIYLYEWLAWTNKAKERAFKRQYSEYAANKLRLIVDLTSTNVSYQVRQEITACKTKLQKEVENFSFILKSECDQLAADISKLDQIASESKKLKNATNYLDKCLDNFQHNYINATWSSSRGSSK